MNKHFESIVYRLFFSDEGSGPLSGFSLEAQFDEHNSDGAGVVKALNAAFLISLSAAIHPASDRAGHFLRDMAKSGPCEDLARYYLLCIELILKEIDSVCAQYPEFRDRLAAVGEWVSEPSSVRQAGKILEEIWSVFFPEGTGIYGAYEERVEQLREKRTVRITRLNPTPLTDPGRQVLFTSNVLLTIPDKSTGPEDITLSPQLKEDIFQAARGPQDYWYDHPIQIGVHPDHNEILHGLIHLNNAVKFERARGDMTVDRISCVLSASVTHKGLQKSAGKYIQEEISRLQILDHVNVYVFTDADTKSIVEDVLVPTAAHFLGHDDPGNLLNIFGVDGEYGRHYSFLKAISALWSVLIDPEIKATFKIDLDQVFPQNELVEQTKASAFEHLKTPLWGAFGVDWQDRAVDMGMIAGALVNARDIGLGLFTPDVACPAGPASPEDWIFFSPLPQALSTEAEMMTRYNGQTLDGARRCIQRIHVTGGTNGVLVDRLRGRRPFTPSFVGRAEDQAYILSVLSDPNEQLAYVHKDGLVMRHDKEAFAQEAINAATPGKQVGDYVRILLFSKYAEVLSKDVDSLKQTVDPFSGCFISRIPVTVVALRFCLRAASLFADGKEEQAADFITMGYARIRKALSFTEGGDSPLSRAYKKERLGWDIFYDILDALDAALARGDHFALEIRDRALSIVQGCLLRDRASAHE